MQIEMIGEKALIRQLKSGHGESLDRLYTAYGQKVYNLAYRLTGNHQDAEDISQETFIRAFRHIKQFRGDSKLYTWIYAIAKNLCHRILKRQKKGAFASMEALIHSAQSWGTTETFSHKEKHTLVNQIKEGCFTGLLRCLSFSQRLAFILHVLLYLPMKDVADILDKSEGATKVLVHRARRNLKEFLCRNCSLYDSNNPCRCENLMGFSLAKGWIKKSVGNRLEEAYAIAPQTIEAEIESMRKVTALYKTLVDQVPSEDFDRRIQKLIQRKDWSIFSHKKV